MRTGAGPAVATRDLRMKYGPREVLQRPGSRTSAAARSSPCSARTAPARPPPSRSWRASAAAPPARSPCSAPTLTAATRRGGPGWASCSSPGATTGTGGCASCSSYLGRFYGPYGTPGRPRPRDVDDLLATVGLTAEAGARVGALSGGQRRRLDVAVGLVGRPDLLFLDEPTTGFDPQARQDFHDLIRSTVAGEEMAVLLTTHDLAEAEKLADRIVILAGGRIVAEGTAAELATQVAVDGEVRYRRGGVAHRDRVPDPTAHVRGAVRPRGPRRGARQRPGRARADAGGLLPGPGASGVRTGGARMSIPVPLRCVPVWCAPGSSSAPRSTNAGELLGWLWLPIVALGVMFVLRGTPVPGTTFSLGAQAVPGVLGFNVVFTGLLGLAMALTMDREDGTLLRAKATPNGMVGYLVGADAGRRRHWWWRRCCWCWCRPRSCSTGWSCGVRARGSPSPGCSRSGWPRPCRSARCSARRSRTRGRWAW